MRLLVVGKIETEVSTACKIAMKRGAKIVNASNIDEGFNLLLNGSGADLVMIDATLDIATFVKNLKQEHINTPIVAYGINVDSKVAAASIKAGAEEFIPLPPEEELIAAVLESIADEKEQIISSSDKMNELISLAERIAPSDANVLITGESGTGKEVMARFLHNKSLRKNEKFVSVNCAAIPDNLLESELFGHEKGSFTGALNRRVGKFEESSGGTLLLDEISEMDLRLQAKLLRAIQEKEIDRVGGTSPVKVNLRVIATSNRDLRDEVKAGRFREDLFFRLNVIHMQLPPLRERKDDIKVFAEHFAEKFAKSNHIATPKLTNEALDILTKHTWPGNVRELENTMHRAVLLNNNGLIDKTSLLMEQPKTMEKLENGAGIEGLVGRTVSEVEKELILSTLGSVNNNRSKAAEILGISIRTLHNKLKEYEQSQGAA
jgi:two-component system response regulator FlrC